MGAAAGTPVCYVLDDYALSSVLILDKVCEQNGLARPLHAISGLEKTERRAYAVLRRLKGFLIMRPSTRRSSDVLKRLVDQCYADPNVDIQLVPVTIFVGRAPDKTSGFAKTLFAENWQIAGRTRRLFSTLINGRDTLVQFSRPISLQELRSEELGASRSLRKVSRILRMHFRRVKNTVIGPDLSHRRMMIDRIIKTPTVRRAIEDKARRDSISVERVTRLARKHAWEIAADYSYRVVHIASMMIAWFTRKVFHGVNMHHFERFKSQALDHEVIYVPCHRSHVDYLLVSYLLHVNGFVPPHIAAGANLNLPIVGRVLRGGGAFYLRRTFKSQKLYAAIFNEYVSTIIAQGVSIEYFVEGTRSRTGRLLPPKAGMLIMTVKGYLHSPVRPVMFQPVYIGYEQLIEASAYRQELSGTAKRSEKLSDLLKVFGVLKKNYGAVTVSFGQPIFLDELLDKHEPDWRENAVPAGEKAPWMNPLIEELGERIMTGINAAADVNPVNLLAMIMLATPRHSLGEQDLLAQLDLCRDLMVNGPFADLITISGKSEAEIVAYGIELGIMEKTPHELGDIVSLDPKKALELTYSRNNVSHLFAVPSLIACCFLNQRAFETHLLRRIALAVYPFLKAELFLPWDREGFLDAIQRNIDLLAARGLLCVSEDGKTILRARGGSEKAAQLNLLARGLLQTLERYYISVAVLAKNGSGTLSRAQLEKLCTLTAQRISRLHGIEAPEFLDRRLFRQFIGELRKLGILSNDENGKLLFDDSLDRISEHARFILSKEIRHGIIRVAPQAIAEPMAD